MLFWNIDLSCLGNINEDLDFEYGYDTVADSGCGATLHNVFWYFGGSGSQKRQVKLQNHLFNINLFHFRSAKLLDASCSVKPIWILILKVEHATLFINLIKKFFFASVVAITDNATRKYFFKTFSYFIQFIF